MDPSSLETDNVAEQERQKFIQYTLQEFGLQVPPRDVNTVTHTLPQFLTSHPTKPAALLKVTEAISPTASEFKDANDTFRFHSFAQIAKVLQEARSRAQEQTEDPSTSQPKHVIVCAHGELPDPEQTPLFNLRLYYDTLSLARAKHGIGNVDPWGMGEVVLYGEAVTSTQTMLDK
jgi:biotin--protein ligase